MEEAAQGTVFEAVIVPHRSLTPRAMGVLIGMLVLLSAGIATLFWHLGAWPVAGFNGGETLLAIVLLRVNAQARRASEVLTLTDRGLRILRTDRHGRRSEAVLPAAWLQVRLAESVGRVPRLLLIGGGREEEVARSLGEAEKRDLAAALRTALHDWRNPRFDNPQLRDPSGPEPD
ncbi:MAG TPA: DUF2244 domain-containing protein [Acetobacteraceae bacterium]|nr:DUF2244 domain-containing protein [Acetobacteraceae bacterium]